MFESVKYKLDKLAATVADDAESVAASSETVADDDDSVTAASATVADDWHIVTESCKSSMLIVEFVNPVAVLFQTSAFPASGGGVSRLVIDEDTGTLTHRAISSLVSCDTIVRMSRSVSSVSAGNCE